MSYVGLDTYKVTVYAPGLLYLFALCIRGTEGWLED